MKANELRIGNKVNYTVSGYQKHIGEITGINKTEDGLKAVIDYHYPLSFGEPIELSPEILDKCGFKRNGDKNSQYYFKDGIRYHPGSKHLKILRGCDKAGESQAGCCGTSLGDSIIINHLHQLQNIYFALTGEELTVNL